MTFYNSMCHTMGAMYPYGMKYSAVMTDEDLSFAGGEVDSSMGFTLVLDALHKVEGIKNANQALILSKIYSLSHDGVSTTRCSIQYLASTSFCTPRTVHNTLNQLIKLGYIYKVNEVRNGVTYANFGVTKKFLSALKGELVQADQAEEEVKNVLVKHGIDEEEGKKIAEEITPIVAKSINKRKQNKQVKQTKQKVENKVAVANDSKKEIIPEPDKENTQENQEKLNKWLQEKDVGEIQGMKEPLTPKQWKELDNKFPIKTILEKMNALLNKPDFKERYSSAYRTLLDWCENSRR